MELSPEQILIIGFVASFLATAIRLVTVWLGGPALGKGVMSIIAGAVSLGLAFLFFPSQWPVFGDPLQFLAEWLTLLSAYVGVATLIYNIVLDKLLNKVNLTPERFAK